MNPDAPVFSKKKYDYVIRNMKYLKDSGSAFITEDNLAALPENLTDKLGSVDVSKGPAAYYYFLIRTAQVVRNKLVRNV